jgi:signal transduction histidine kinase
MTVLGTPLPLQQVVSNLLSKAINFTPEEGRLLVRLDYAELFLKRAW